MTLKDLGLNDRLEKFITQEKLNNHEIGRVISEHKERYVVKTHINEYDAEITGNMRYSAVSREDFPSVGDWVVFISYDSNLAIIHKILPRFSCIKRRAVGHFGEIQVIASNIDYAFLIQAVDRDFSINRLERYLTLCYSSGVSPVIVFTKTDLIDSPKLKVLIDATISRIKDVTILAISNETLDGYESVRNHIEKGKTYCLLGSSGAGKSTLLNNLNGRQIMKTAAISKTSDRGRHITSHRELVVLEDGGILIDNPGIREVGITDTIEGVESAFDLISDYSQKCRFRDCTHTSEKGCSVIEAIKNGLIDSNSYDNYLKIEKERAHFEMSVSEKKKKEKIFGKIIKDYNSKNVKGKRH